MFLRCTLSLSLFLLGCATGASSVREEATASASASAGGGTAGPATSRPARLSYAKPGGWSVRDAADGVHLYHGDPSHAVLRMALEPSTATPEERARREAEALAARGASVGPIEAVGSYASFAWQGDLGSGPRHGRVAVRRPSGAPGSLIVMSGLWPPSSDGLAEQVDMLFLLATAE